ncbi:hypothetical protein ACFRCW_42365 [Streptomyces sp. NPDC056653]|uniref:hypothetical protein n=1 Tax=Streptomyces sp. NPDC056653 TaxID=3345894 RepID=UPI0036A09EBE
MSDPEPGTADFIASCQTPACPAFSQPVPITLHDNADGVYRCVCGVCSQPNNLEPVAR